MSLTAKQTGLLIRGMRDAYKSGDNAMLHAKKMLGPDDKGLNKRDQGLPTLIAYDIQAGTYVDYWKRNKTTSNLWCKQLANILQNVLPEKGSLLEVGVGEATTLAGVLDNLAGMFSEALGFDLSWSRVAVAKSWLRENNKQARLFVGDLFNIPLADDSVDVVYTSHSLEPNGGREKQAIAECLRVARHAVVLVEPIYELAPPQAQTRMEKYGYVRNLKAAAEKLGAVVQDYRLLPFNPTPLNPSGVLTVRKNNTASTKLPVQPRPDSCYHCPLTGSRLIEHDGCYFAAEVGVAYPILRGTPILTPNHAIVASRLETV